MEQFKLTECKIHSKANLSFPGVFACRVRHSQLSALSLLVNRLTLLLGVQMNLNQYSSLLNALLNVGKEEEHTLTIDGDLLTVLAIESVNRSTVHFRDSIDDSLLFYNIQADEGPIWMEGMGQTNPLAADDVANVVIANGGLTPLILKVGMLINTN